MSVEELHVLVEKVRMSERRRWLSVFDHWGFVVDHKNGTITGRKEQIDFGWAAAYSYAKPQNEPPSTDDGEEAKKPQP